MTVDRQRAHELLDKLFDTQAELQGVLGATARGLPLQVYGQTPDVFVNEKTLVDRVLEFMQKHPSENHTFRAVAVAVGGQPVSVRTSLWNLKRKGVVKKVGRDAWRIAK